MLVVDGHLDLAMNAVMWNRDLALLAHETRRFEREEGEDGAAAGAARQPHAVRRPAATEPASGADEREPGGEATGSQSGARSSR